MPPKKFNIYVSHGCSRRPLECGRYYNYFTTNGWEYTSSLAEADLILIYTCGGFQKTEDQSLLTLERALKEKKKKSELVVTGCLTKINKPLLQEKYVTVDPEDLDVMDTLIEPRVKLADIPPSNLVPDINGLIPLPRVKEFKKTFLPSFSLLTRLGKLLSRPLKGAPEKKTPEEKRFYLRIADGCLGNCSYCAIKISCGKLRSKKIDHILKEFKRGLKEGFETFVILAEDTGCYGRDINTNIVKLLKKLFEVEGQYKFIIKDFNPHWLVRYQETLIPLLQENKNKLIDMRIPIQSGSDKILQKMRRPYRIDDFKTCLRDLKSRIPGLAIYTHFMVGFPGETEKDFKQTKQILKEFDYEDYHVYCFEARPGTPAFNMTDEITEKVKKTRKRILDNLK
jgi:tRNA A37 methylthiotransferase MiaB